MNFILQMFQPAPYLPEIEDQQKVDKEYRYWRIRILYSMLIGYSFYYFTRKSFTFAMPGMIAELGFDKIQLGMLGSILAITYGISKFTSGILADHSNPRFMMAFGLILSGICNICFGFSSSLILFGVFWGLNGWFQGFGFPPCARFLTQWYSHSERGSWWSTWAVSHNLGGFLIPWITGLALHSFGWRYAMYIPGTLCILMGFFLINRLRDTPQSIGLPPIGKYRNDQIDKVEAGADQKVSMKTGLVEDVLKNPYIWLLGIIYFFIYVVRSGVNDWTALFLVETKGYSTLGANGCVSLFDVGGFCGILVAGWSSDRIFGAKRGPVNFLFAICMLVFVGSFWFVPFGQTFLDPVFMFLIGFSVWGPQMLIGLMASELAHKRSASTANGFVGLFAYIGTAFAGAPLGGIIQNLGWNGYFWALVACCATAILFLVPLLFVTTASLKAKARRQETGVGRQEVSQT